MNIWFSHELRLLLRITAVLKSHQGAHVPDQWVAVTHRHLQAKQSSRNAHREMYLQCISAGTREFQLDNCDMS